MENSTDTPDIVSQIIKAHVDSTTSNRITSVQNTTGPPYGVFEFPEMPPIQTYDSGSTTNPGLYTGYTNPTDSKNSDHTAFDPNQDVKWNLAKLTIKGSIEADHRLLDYLAAGWEPFAVIGNGNNSFVVFLRRLEVI